MDTFIIRLRHRPILTKLNELKKLKDELCLKRVEAAKLNKSKPWKLEYLLKVLSSLKNGKSRDPHGLINELFQPRVGVIDFQKCVGNKIKEELIIPEFMQFSEIVAIYKWKGEKMDLNNERGIFIVNIFRAILMKMVYRDKYHLVDQNISDSNVGAQKDKNIRNNICV